MAYIKVVAQEISIIFTYAFFPTFLSLILSFLNWNFDVLMSLIRLFIFLRIEYNDDSKVGKLRLRYIIVKLAVAIVAYYLTDKAAIKLEKLYLPPDLVSTTIRTNQIAKIRVSKARAEFLSKRSDASSIAKLAGVRILAEYLHMCAGVAHYRWAFLASTIALYGFLHFLIWYCVPRSRRHDTEDESTDDRY